MLKLFWTLPLICALCSCGSAPNANSPGPASPTPPATSPPEEKAKDTSWLATWTPETIPFPPGFAPSLPAGKEMLLFAPGWRKPGAEDHWAYVLMVELEESDADLAEFFELYYDGLSNAVGNGKPFELPDDPSTTTLKPTGANAFEGHIDMLDVFGDGRPLHLNVRVRTEQHEGRTRIFAQLSPQPRTHPVWHELQGALDEIELHFDSPPSAPAHE